MTLNLEAYQVIGLCITIVGAIWGTGKAFFARFEASMKERDKALEDIVKQLQIGQQQHGQEIHRLEREMLKMQTEANKIYVHKDDFNRTFTVVNAKLDRIWEKLPK